MNARIGLGQLVLRSERNVDLNERNFNTSRQLKLLCITAETIL